MDADRAAEILDATARVIARDGWHGLRTGAVADEAGVSKALVHYYFQTRQELLRAAFHHVEGRVTARAEAEVALAAAGADRVVQYLLLDYADDQVVAESRAIWRDVFAAVALDADLREEVGELYRTWLARLADLIEEGRADGSIPAAVDAEGAALRLAAASDGIDSLLVAGVVELTAARALLRDAVAAEIGLAAGLAPSEVGGRDDERGST